MHILKLSTNCYIMLKNILLRATLMLLVSFMVLLSASCTNGVDESVNPRMGYRDLGATGLRVSEIGIGCGPFEDMSPEESRAYMDVALDSGINYIDIYDANPLVRSNIGYALKDRRDRMIIQGHVGCFWNGTSYERTRNRQQAERGFSDLLDLLGTDHIEVGMLHIVDKMDEWDTILNSQLMDYLRQLKQEGKVQHIGMSSHNVDVAMAAAKSGEFEVIMFSMNPTFDRLTSDHNPWEKDAEMLPGIDPKRVEFYDYCTQHHIAITNMKTFGGGGRLLKADQSPLGFALTPTQCIAYCLSKPCCAVAIAGASTIEQLQEDLHYLTATDQEKDFNSVLQRGVADAYTNEAGNQCGPESATVKAAASVNGNQCTYCNHCAPCPVGIDIGKVNKLLDQARGKNPVPEQVKKEYEALEHHASECIGCAQCEERCPFSVPVRERMQEAVKVFGK